MIANHNDDNGGTHVLCFRSTLILAITSRDPTTVDAALAKAGKVIKPVI